MTYDGKRKECMNVAIISCLWAIGLACTSCGNEPMNTFAQLSKGGDSNWVQGSTSGANLKQIPPNIFTSGSSIWWECPSSIQVATFDCIQRSSTHLSFGLMDSGKLVSSASWENLTLIDHILRNIGIGRSKGPLPEAVYACQKHVSLCFLYELETLTLIQTCSNHAWSNVRKVVIYMLRSFLVTLLSSADC
jgi:hypothetical protein